MIKKTFFLYKFFFMLFKNNINFATNDQKTQFQTQKYVLELLLAVLQNLYMEMVDKSPTRFFIFK